MIHIRINSFRYGNSEKGRKRKKETMDNEGKAPLSSENIKKRRVHIKIPHIPKPSVQNNIT